jgi:hypothetical protein
MRRNEVGNQTEPVAMVHSIDASDFQNMMKTGDRWASADSAEVFDRGYFCEPEALFLIRWYRTALCCHIHIYKVTRMNYKVERTKCRNTWSIRVSLSREWATSRADGISEKDFVVFEGEGLLVRWCFYEGAAVGGAWVINVVERC